MLRLIEEPLTGLVRIGMVEHDIAFGCMECSAVVQGKLEFCRCSTDAVVALAVVVAAAAFVVVDVLVGQKNEFVVVLVALGIDRNENFVNANFVNETQIDC